MNKALEQFFGHLWPVVIALLMFVMFLGVASISESRLEKYIQREFEVMPADVHEVTIETQKSIERIEKILTEKIK